MKHDVKLSNFRGWFIMLCVGGFHSKSFLKDLLITIDILMAEKNLLTLISHIVNYKNMHKIKKRKEGNENFH